MRATLQISRKIDYALRAAVYLASLPPGTVLSFKEIARASDLPRDFLGKILKSMADCRLVYSVRGPAGGYRLARSPEEISFLDVIEAVEGSVQLSGCLESPDHCVRSSVCLMNRVWREAQEQLLCVLRKNRLRDVVPVRPARSLPRGRPVR